jgi:hypothetical protein
MQGSNAGGRKKGEEVEETTGTGTFRGFSVRCGCGALAFDWITGESGSFVLRCSSCDATVLEASDVTIGEEQLDRLERLEDRRVRV